MTDTPNPVDVHVGRRIRQRRRSLGLTQETLADSLGLTFQQVQKYERGANRVSASKLFQIACRLRTPIEWFFAGLGDPTGGDTAPARPDPLLAFSVEPGALDLAQAYVAAPRHQRAALVNLASTLGTAH